MDDPLPPDVLERLTVDFGERSDSVAALLAAHRALNKDSVCDRLIRCIVHAACGNEQRISHLIDLERIDFRDVVMAAEYDEANRRVRDLRVSFLIDSPDKFWASEVACLMAVRGYRLMGVESRHATAGPFTYTADFYEGQARFNGPKGEIVIEKKDREWMIHGNRHDLAIHELDRQFGDEREFRDAVSCYLLSNVRARVRNEPNEGPTVKPKRRFWWMPWA